MATHQQQPSVASVLGEVPPLGHAMLQYFTMEQGFTNLNHGSFGCTPRIVRDKQRQFTDDMEALPDVWLRKTYREHVNASRKALAEYVHADEDGLVMVECASTAVSSVLRSLPFSAGDTILYLSTAYPMVIRTATYLRDRHQLELLQVNVEFPTSHDIIVSLVQAAIEKHNEEKKGPIKIAVFSHISSLPSIIIPVERLVPLCHEHGILVMIDGAHAPGQIAIDVNALGADFYTGTAQKWLFTPKAAAFLWVAEAHRKVIVPTVISYEFDPTRSFDFNFLYTGTRDYTPFCTIPCALGFLHWVGEDKIFSYLHKLAVEAGHYLANYWGTEVLTGDDDSMVAGMVNVRLPHPKDPNIFRTLTDVVMEQHRIYFVVYPLQGAFYTRLSAQIYLEMSDFVKLGEVVKKILAT